MPFWRNLAEFLPIFWIHLGPQRSRQDELANVARKAKFDLC